MPRRPSPRELLAYVKREEQARTKGKLRIYLGAAPGVGKTYAMLEAAIQKKNEGIDVVAGIVETHGRKETDLLLQKLEIIPRKNIKYHGLEFEEFDIDAVLAREPSLVLVDEMAHTNIPGMRHAKRWQDIIELLDRGIDVYSTLNVQHIESLNNIVSEITGIVVRETVPDTVLEKANSIELIDLPPEDLLKRLEEGKVYVPSEIGTAIENFFKKGNLTALRELSLRMAAEQVNAEVLLHRRGESIEKIWPTAERLMVCIGPDELGAKLIRSTFRMAKSFQATWLALYVERFGAKISEEDNRRIIQNLRLAEQLGGETLIVTGTSLVDEVLNVARDRNITKIILGKKARNWFSAIFHESLSDNLILRSSDIDLYILRKMPDTDKEQKSLKCTTPLMTNARKKAPLIEYMLSIAIVIVCTLINWGLFKFFEASTLVMIYFLGIILIARRGYFGPSVMTSILSVLAFGLTFSPLAFSFKLVDIQYLITLFAMLLVSQIIVQLTLQTRMQALSARVRAERSTKMHQFSKQLSSARGSKLLLSIALKEISEVFDCEVLVILPGEDGSLKEVYDLHLNSRELSFKDMSLAQWAFELGRMAGLGSETLPDNEALYIPLIGTRMTIGVLRVKPKNREMLVIPGQVHLLEGFVDQTALALEVDRLNSEATHREIEIETDRVRNALLKGFSENMRAPLFEIMNVSKELIAVGQVMNAPSIKGLGDDIYNNAEDLTHLIFNITQIAKLESTDVALKKEPNSLYEVLQTAVHSLRKKLEKKPVNIFFDEQLPLINFNKIFIEQVFYNIIDNAIKYTPKETAIDINATIEPYYVLVSIADQGPGISLEEINKIFEKFYRGQAITHVKGLGIGLAICQRIIELHQGEIWAETKPQGGSIFRFTLPYES